MVTQATDLSIQAVLQQAVAGLTDSDSARLDAEILLAFVLQQPRSYLYAWPERRVSAEEYAQFTALLARRRAGEPIAYLVGQQEFWSLTLQVSPATLIPRPETELLVEQVLHRLPAAAEARVLDLGTGSGAIALAIAKARPHWQVLATDISEAALAIARANAARAAIANVQLQRSDWFAQLSAAKFAAIVANPPYLAADDEHLTQGDVRFEPRHALVAGADGLAAIRMIVADAGAYLERDGWLLLEHGYTQADAVQHILLAHGFQAVYTVRDLAGWARVTGGRREQSTQKL